MKQNMQNKKKKDGLIKLAYKDQDRQNWVVVEHKWSGSVERIHRFHELTDKLEALCGLPSREELPQILKLSAMNAVPAVWTRARLSPLEETAIAILSTLAFSSRKHQLRLLREFFRHEGWQVDLRGRPSLDPRDEDLLPLMRGLKIEKTIARLKPGFLFKAQEKKEGGYDSDDGQIARQLEGQGYDQHEVRAIMKARSPQDAACRYFREMKCEVSLTLKSIRNDYAKYKRIKRRFPSSFANSPLADA